MSAFYSVSFTFLLTSALQQARDFAWPICRLIRPYLGLFLLLCDSLPIINKTVIRISASQGHHCHFSKCVRGFAMILACAEQRLCVSVSLRLICFLGFCASKLVLFPRLNPGRGYKPWARRHSLSCPRYTLAALYHLLRESSPQSWWYGRLKIEIFCCKANKIGWSPLFRLRSHLKFFDVDALQSFKSREQKPYRITGHNRSRHRLVRETFVLRTQHVHDRAYFRVDHGNSDLLDICMLSKNQSSHHLIDSVRNNC